MIRLLFYQSCPSTAHKPGAVRFREISCNVLISNDIRQCSGLARRLTIYDIMVHHRHDRQDTATYPSPLCPKCGSHRTEIVGMSQDLKITYLRCAVCGARSEFPARDAVARVLARREIPGRADDEFEARSG